jgi:RNA polymerase sigma-70 factor (ECF subfamily)
VGLDEIGNMPDKTASENAASEREVLQQLLTLIHRLKPLDRQVILSYLEGMDAVEIGEIGRNLSLQCLGQNPSH